MKKSELTQLIKEEIKKILLEAKHTHTCHECLEDFKSKELYNIEMKGHYVPTCLECLKELKPKEWKKIKKEHDDYEASKKKKD